MKEKANLFLKSLSIGVLFLCNIALLNAQNNIITLLGNVKSTEGESLIGASVVESGTSNGTITDVNGNFTLKVSKDAILNISYVGMKSITVSVNGNSRIDIVMEDMEKNLGEVVVTALGMKRERKALGYAISEIGANNLTAGREGNPIAALSGKVAGVDISQTTAGASGSTRVLIRGNSELSGDNSPLYVVDGVQIDNTQLGSAGKWGGYDLGDGLSSISPSDIESVTVLKGPSASALYGSRATHGVVLITTKLASKRKSSLGIDFSTEYNSVSLLTKLDDYQRVYGQGKNGSIPANILDAQGTSQVAWGAKMDENQQSLIYNNTLKDYGNKENNIMSFFRSGGSFSNSLALSGGSGGNNFRISVSDVRHKDVVPNSDMSRTTFMIRGASKLGNKISIEGRVNYSIEKVNNRPGLSDAPSNIGNALNGLAPNFDQKWLNESYKDEYGRYTDWNRSIYRINPYWVINEMKNNSEKNRVMGYLLFNYKPTKNITLQIKPSTDFFNFKALEFEPIYTPTSPTGKIGVTNRNVSETNVEGMIRYDQRFGNISLNTFVAGNLRYYKDSYLYNSGEGQVVDKIVSISNYRIKRVLPIEKRKQVNSIYGAVNLGYKDFLYLDLTLRNDISSTLSPNNRSYLYPSISSSLIFTSLININKKILSFGKIRGSFAIVGGDTDPGQLDLLYGISQYTINGLPMLSIQSAATPNKNLRPTKTRSFEVGTELRFIDGRINLDMTYYYQSTIDQILRMSTPVSSGYNYALINAGEIRNKGFEFSLTGDIVNTKDFTWNTNFNFSINRNEVVKLHPQIKNYELAQARWAGGYIYASEGQPYGVIVGKGFQRDPNGNVIYKNGLPLYDANVKVLGNGVYDFKIGFGQTFTYKGISLSALFDMKWGAKLFSMSSMMSHQNGTSMATLEGREEWYASEQARIAAGATAENWTPTGGYLGEGVKNIGTEANPEYVKNDVYVDPQIYWSNVSTNTPEPFIMDASFIKLREMNLSYSLPQSILKNTPFVSVSISLYGRNLWILYNKLKNIDPESNYNNGNGQGLEYGSLPSRKTFGVGINVKL